MFTNSEACLQINYENLKYNLNWMRAKTSSTFVCPMVKANAYGAGAALVAQALASMNITHLGVARISEAQVLRQQHISQDLLLFNHFTKTELDKIVDLRITPVVSALEQLRLLLEFASERQITFKFHLEFDTGMSRLGFVASQIPAIKAILNEAPLLRVEGIYTHFLEASNFPDEGASSWRQYQAFAAIVKEFPQAQAHIASSKALGKVQAPMEFGIRPGIWLYGVEGQEFGLKPVLKLTAPIIALKEVDVGTTVSYGGLWQAQVPSLIATIPLGYGDGFSRKLTGQAHVLVRGQIIPVVGAVCMDYMMLDVTSLRGKINLGEDVLIFGDDEASGQQISVETLAKKCDVIAYEFIVGLAHRLKRQLVGGPSGITRTIESDFTL